MAAGLTLPVQADPVRQGQIVFVHAPGGLGPIATLSSQGGTAVELTHGQSDFDPSWLPDGSCLFVSFDKASESCQINRMDGDGKNRRSLYQATEKLTLGPQASPDGRSIVFSQMETRLPDALPRIHLMDAEGGHVHALGPITGSFPAWRPDGHKILFVTGHPDPKTRARLQTMDPDGHGLETVFSSPNPIIDCSYSPDGKEIVFTQIVEVGKSRIFVLEPGGTPRPLTDGSDTSFGPHFDGSGLIYNRVSNNQVFVWRMNADGSQPQRLSEGVIGSSMGILMQSPQEAPTPSGR